MHPVIASVQVGMPQSRGEADASDPFERLWTSAIFKSPVDGPVELGPFGLAGDGQADRENHGGVDKAVLFYAADHYAGWKQVAGMESASYGAFGENLSVTGADETTVCIGDTWQVGVRAVIQVSQPRQPCWKLARKWRIKELVAVVQANGRTGWYCRVLTPGRVEAGQAMHLLERPHAAWTVARGNKVMHQLKKDAALALELAALPELAASWRVALEARAARLANG